MQDFGEYYLYPMLIIFNQTKLTNQLQMRHLKEARKNHSSESNQKRSETSLSTFSLEKEELPCMIYTVCGKEIFFLVNVSEYDTEELWEYTL